MAENTAVIDAQATGAGQQANIVIPEVKNNAEVKQNAPEQDLLSKVANFNKSSSQKATPATDNQDFFDYKQIEAIQDPVAKDIAIKAYKSMQAGLTQKTQALAEQRKEIEKKMQEGQRWTTDRIQRELLNNPEFLQAAQFIAGQSQVQNPQNSGLTNEEFSALTDKEKSELAAMKQQVNLIQQQNQMARVQQEHAALQAKYADYNPAEVSRLWEDLATGRVQATHEHLYKVANYERAVQSAYELGKQEALKLNQERTNGAAMSGVQAATTTGIPVRDKNESDTSFLVRLAQFRLAQTKNRS